VRKTGEGVTGWLVSRQPIASQGSYAALPDFRASATSCTDCVHAGGTGFA
jgi:hypothetical protein